MLHSSQPLAGSSLQLTARQAPLMASTMKAGLAQVAQRVGEAQTAQPSCGGHTGWLPSSCAMVGSIQGRSAPTSEYTPGAPASMPWVTARQSAP